MEKELQNTKSYEYIGSCTNKKNKINFVCQSNTGKVFLKETYRKRITPLVDKIEYDAENEVFLLTEGVSVDGKIAGSISFYVDFEGQPLGMGYTNLFVGLIPITYDEKDPDVEKREGITINHMKDAYYQLLLAEANKQEKHYRECAKKMMLCDKNKH